MTSDPSSPVRWLPTVAVPARDEEARLPALLVALAGQTWLARNQGPLPVTVALNNCTDRSAAVVMEAQARHPRLRINLFEATLPTGAAHVGTARRRAMDEAWESLDHHPNAVILTTDADATPEPEWVEANLRAVAAGADAVGGLIIGDPEEEAQLGVGVLLRAGRQGRYAGLADQLAALIDPLVHDPWPRHRDHTGASLAVRAQAYAAVGGLPALPFREDLALVRRLRKASFLLVHPLDVRVGVSARLDGRAPGGMADCLRGWMRDAAEGRPHLVEAPADIVARLHSRRALRLTEGVAAGAAIERFAADDPDAAGVMPVDEAILALEALIAGLEVRADAT